MKLTSFILLITTVQLSGQIKGNPSPEAIYAKARSSFVTIWTFDTKHAPLAQGSGFVVAKNRVATNWHVVAGSNSASLAFEGGEMSVVKGVVAGSAPKDLLIIEADTGEHPPLVLGDELQLNIGETIYAIGSPMGLTASLSSGLVSGFRQDEGQFLIQVTAVIAPGSSGGPLLNKQGQVVGVTTSRLADGSFGFAMGAGDLRHLLKVPLSAILQLSDLVSNESTPEEGNISAAQSLFDQKKYDEAYATFASLSAATKSTYDGELLLCRIEQERKEYQAAVRACDSAIQSRPNEGAPYGSKAFSFISLGNYEKAEAAATKATSLSDDGYFKTLLGAIHYSEEKYDLVVKDVPANTQDAFALSLLTGAALHNHNYDSYWQFQAKLATAKKDNGWKLLTDAVGAVKELKWDEAIAKYRQCDADPIFIDSLCILGLASAESINGDYESAKKDITEAVSRYPRNAPVLSEGIFIYLLTGDMAGADRLHDALKASSSASDFSDCLYYYGRNQAAMATNHCEATIKADPNTYTSWSNSGYVALDNGDFKTTWFYFAKASQLFDAEKTKHTATQELDIYWVTQNPKTITSEIRVKLERKSWKGSEDNAQERSHGRADRGGIATGGSRSACGRDMSQGGD